MTTDLAIALGLGLGGFGVLLVAVTIAIVCYAQERKSLKKSGKESATPKKSWFSATIFKNNKKPVIPSTLSVHNPFAGKSSKSRDSTLTLIPLGDRSSCRINDTSEGAKVFTVETSSSSTSSAQSTTPVISLQKPMPPKPFGVTGDIPASALTPTTTTTAFSADVVDPSRPRYNPRVSNATGPSSNSVMITEEELSLTVQQIFDSALSIHEMDYDNIRRSRNTVYPEDY